MYILLFSILSTMRNPGQFCIPNRMKDTVDFYALSNTTENIIIEFWIYVKENQAKAYAIFVKFGANMGCVMYLYEGVYQCKKQQPSVLHW